MISYSRNYPNHQKKTKIIIANTIKGKGFKKFEDNPEWHYGIISKKILDECME